MVPPDVSCSAEASSLGVSAPAQARCWSASGEDRAARLYAPLVQDLDAATASLGEAERRVVAEFLARISEIGEARAEELVRSAELERPQVPRVPVPGLWA